ncbi:E3 ubiquitin-protein ligase TRIM36-like [Ostrea edulis]|uniref:E3 ubiquitin-protein ligase TRIM36-like n=1 Tax=Ostrea edulis TaxID=37623 RepID=UPI0024AFCC18|nr:E3 ubiquitin-protein ligase TRIM36-like [Ostrea edulis]XP_056021783.1 E3 ubiquitin-protein ligase TRIM36-like [Ostrea edulis]
MESTITIRGQHLVECHICQEPVSFFCRRCGVNLCDSCVPVHLRMKSKTGHIVVNYGSGDYDDTCTCDSHPQNECCVYCQTCDVPICMVCVLNKHKSHEMFELSKKIEEMIEIITRENERLQKYKYELEKILDHTIQRLPSLSKIYQQKKDEVTSRGEELHRHIEKNVKLLHQELDDMQKEHESLLQEQKKELEEILRKVDEMKTTTTKLKNSQNVLEMKKCMIENQETPSEITQYSFPVFCEAKIDDNSFKSYFGYNVKIQEKRISLSKVIFYDNEISSPKILEVPKVITTIDTEFPAREKYNSRLYDIAVIDVNRVCMGGESKELKAFDFLGNLHATVPITAQGMYLTVYNKQVVCSVRRNINSVYRVADDKAIHTMFTTGEWEPYGITSTMSNELLVCLRKDDLSKIVRYNSTGTVLQEIQYNSQGQPLYGKTNYVTENINGDIIVTDWKKNAVTAVDRLGIFRFSYSGRGNEFDVCAVTTDPAGHVIVTDSAGNKIHMLDRNGTFLRYIIPEGGIKEPRAVCFVGDGEMFVGEQKTGIAKRIKYLEK